MAEPLRLEGVRVFIAPLNPPPPTRRQRLVHWFRRVVLRRPTSQWVHVGYLEHCTLTSAVPETFARPRTAEETTRG